MRGPLRAGASAAALAALAGSAQAERVVVRSGEHDGFTRIVLGFEAAPRFELRRIEGGYRLDPEGDATYDLSDAWRRIDRDRVAALEPREDGSLDILLDCDCEAKAFGAGSALVAVDVSGDPSSEPPEATPIAAPVLLPPAAFPPALLPTVAPPAPAPAAPEAPEPAPPDLAAFGADLVAQLRQGVDRGLLEPAAPFEGSDDPEPGAGGLRVSTGTGAAPWADPLGPAVVAACPAAGVAALLPGAEEGTAEGIAEARRALFGELDQADPTAARAYVGELLSAGFGAEARVALGMTGLDARARVRLDAVAALLDAGPPGEDARVLETWASCEGPAALWAVLTLEGRPLPRALDRGGVVGALSAMPHALRLHLAPRLAGVFLDDGDAATARLVRNAAARTGDAPDAAMRLLDARIALEADPADAAARAALAELATGRDDVALEAAGRLLEAGGAPAQALEDAAILVAERRGHPSGEVLRAALVEASADAGLWDEALALVEAAPDAAPGTAALWEDAVRRLASAAPDPVFLRLAFAEAETLAAAPISPRTAAAVEARLEALGFGAPPPAATAAAVPPEGAPATSVPEAPAAGEVAAAERVPAPGAEAPAPPPVPPGLASAVERVPLSGPISSGRRSLEESRRRRADLAARLDSLGADPDAAAVAPTPAGLPAEEVPGAATPEASTLR